MTEPKEIEYPLNWISTARVVRDLLIPGKFREYADYQKMGAREQQVMGWALVAIRVIAGFIVGLLVVVMVPVLLKSLLSALISLVVTFVVIPLILVTAVFLGMWFTSKHKK